MKIPQYIGKLPNFQYIGEIGGGAFVGNFKQYVPQFSNLDTDSKRYYRRQSFRKQILYHRNQRKKIE